jgi:sodium/hydrogen antiporter
VSGTAALLAVFVVYGLLASRFDRWFISAPIFFVVTGLILGSSGADILSGLDSETTLVVTELTLGVLLFADAATVQLREVEGDARLPVRLLLVGLPLTIALGTVAAKVFFPEAGWAAAALIATILAPTDAALGLAVVTNPAVPARIRRALNVESGLNDGIATPFVTLFLTLLLAEEGLGSGHWAAEAAKEIGLALVAAVAIGVLGGKLLMVARRLGWTSAISEQLVVLALSLLAYVGAVAIGGNGFVAAFVGGLVFGASTGSRMHEPVEFTETVGLFASFFVWTLFGATFVGPVVTGDIEPLAILYAVVSLTVVRMMPVAAAAAGTGLRRDTVAFMGWFGPRGLASVVFTLIAVEELHGSGPVAGVITEIATWTILLSVMAHGLSADPIARAYGRRLSTAEDIPELAEAPEPRIRRRDIVSREQGGRRSALGYESSISDDAGLSREHKHDQP